MPVASGTEVYNTDVPPVVARGYLYSQADIDAAGERLRSILTDQSGRDSLAEFYEGLELTQFGSEKVAEALTPIAEEEHSRGWRSGEVLAEAWLVDHKQCEFPWSFNRDLRHYRASLPGAELLGFAGEGNDVRFAFGQVKTSKEQLYPPQVINRGDKSLINQMLQLRDDLQIKKTIVNYLAYRAVTGVRWSGKFRVAATQYFNSGMEEVTLFGVLVRDVQPTAADLAGAAARLSDRCPASSRIEFCGLYLPLGSLPPGPQRAPRDERRTT